MSETKKCPFCAEEINAEATKCKHCKEFLNGESKSVEPPKEVQIPKGEIKCPFCLKQIQPQPKQATAGTMLIMIILLCFFVIPGIIYMIYDSGKKQCPECKSVLS